jgi:hypothetical protein
MKYIITEEQEKVIDQSKFNMGPLGYAIRQVMDIYDLPWVTKYIVMYLEDNDYLNGSTAGFGKKLREINREINNE